MRIGVDVGGTKIEAVAIDRRGDIVLRHRIPTPAHDYAAAVEAIAGLVERVEVEVDTRCLLAKGCAALENAIAEHQGTPARLDHLTETPWFDRKPDTN